MLGSHHQLGNFFFFFYFKSLYLSHIAYWNKVYFYDSRFLVEDKWICVFIHLENLFYFTQPIQNIFFFLVFHFTPTPHFNIQSFYYFCFSKFLFLFCEVYCVSRVHSAYRDYRHLRLRRDYFSLDLWSTSYCIFG